MLLSLQFVNLFLSVGSGRWVAAGTGGVGRFQTRGFFPRKRSRDLKLQERSDDVGQYQKVLSHRKTREHPRGPGAIGTGLVLGFSAWPL